MTPSATRTCPSSRPSSVRRSPTSRRSGTSRSTAASRPSRASSPNWRSRGAKDAEIKAAPAQRRKGDRRRPRALSERDRAGPAGFRRVQEPPLPQDPRGRDALARAADPIRGLLRGRHGRGDHLPADRPHRPRCRGDQAARDDRRRRRAQAPVGTAPPEGHQAPQDRHRVQPPRRQRAPGQRPPGHDPRLGAGDPARPAPDGAARRWPVRHLRPQRPLPPGHQPEQPAEEASRPGRARDHHQQREADAARGGRRPLRQRPPGPPGHRAGQPPAQEPLGHAEGQAGTVPPEPAGQAGRLLGPFGHRDRPDPPAPPVRAAQADGPRAVQAVRDEAAGRRRVRPEHQVGQADGRASASPGVGRARRGDQGAPGAVEPGPHPPPPGHPGLRAGAGRGQGHPGPPAGVHRLQRRLRRRPDGRPPAPVGRGPGRGPGADAVGQQHPVTGHRPSDHRAHPGHGLRHLLPHPAGRRGQGRGPDLPPRLRGGDRVRQRGHRPAGQDRRPARARLAPGPVHRPGQRGRARRRRQPDRRRRGRAGGDRPPPPVGSSSTPPCPTATATSTTSSASGTPPSAPSWRRWRPASPSGRWRPASTGSRTSASATAPSPA